MSLVGWYVHHVGTGHLTRALSVAPYLSEPPVLFSSLARPASWPASHWVGLPRDDQPGGRDHAAGGVLHWAPLGSAGYGERMRLVGEWICQAQPAAVVVDVSSEVVLLARTLGIPVASVVMAGDRRDRTHQLAYDAATALLACWPDEAQPVLGWKDSWGAKTTWTGAVSRFDGRRPTPPPRTRSAMWLWGRGGPRLTDDDVATVAAATPDWTWTPVVGRGAEQVWASLQDSDVVVTHAGQNALAEVAAARRLTVVLPQQRPHDEQLHLARALSRLGVVRPTTSWPEPDRWDRLLRRAAPADPRSWARWSTGDGASRMAAAVEALAARRAA